MSMAFLYAGQGSQHAGMGADLYRTYPTFARIIDEADRAVGFDLRSCMFEDPDGLLGQTAYTQPCMVAFACGLTAVLAEHGITPQYVAGLSLGEYSALACAGVFEPQQAVELAAFRGRAMTQAAQGRDTAMVSVLGVDAAAVEEAVSRAAAAGAGVVEVSNYNCPRQTVIAGDAAAVEAAVAALRAAGARRCVPLKVSGPFHTSLLAPAGAALAQRFTDTAFGEMRIPVLFNCLGREMGEGDRIDELLVRQVQSAVRMEATIHRMAELSVDLLVEIGPGKVLTGLVRKAEPGMRCVSVETAAQLDALFDEMQSEGK